MSEWTRRRWVHIFIVPQDGRVQHQHELGEDEFTNRLEQQMAEFINRFESRIGRVEEVLQPNFPRVGIVPSASMGALGGDDDDANSEPWPNIWEHFVSPGSKQMKVEIFPNPKIFGLRVQSCPTIYGLKYRPLPSIDRLSKNIVTEKFEHDKNVSISFQC